MIIDIRKKSAYEQGHIPGALSFPFSHNPEKWRAQLLDFSHPDWDAYKAAFRSFLESHPSTSPHIYCHAGAWRCHAFAALAQETGIPVAILPGGYRAFQEEREKIFLQQYPFVVLAGESGSGKTALLNALHRRGEQVLDLEKLADHKGSAFGRLEHLNPQIPNEQFKNELAAALRVMNRERVIWVEDEGKFLGRVGIPTAMWVQMQTAPVIKLEVLLARRVQNILAQYGHLNRDLLAQAIHNIKDRLGENAATALAALRNTQLESVVRLVLNYYDQAYALQLRGRNIVSTLQLDDGEMDRVCAELKNMFLEKIFRIQH